MSVVMMVKSYQPVLKF